MQYKL